MGNAMKWIGGAVRGLRSFAYGPGDGRPRVGLALGGGFARGISHIGVLKVLEQEGIRSGIYCRNQRRRADRCGLCQRREA